MYIHILIALRAFQIAKSIHLFDWVNELEAFLLWLRRIHSVASNPLHPSCCASLASMTPLY